MAKKNLSQKVIRLLRKTEQFMLDEPRRFDMKYGVTGSFDVPGILEQPPCGTTCCIGGSMYVMLTKTPLTGEEIDWTEIMDHLQIKLGITRDGIFRKLFFMAALHGPSLYSDSDGTERWPKFYEDAYLAAKTPLQRVCVGIARIEHFIATDGRE